MKHTFKITLFLVIIFILSQLMGLVIINQYIDIDKTAETGRTHVKEEAFNKTGLTPPQLEPEQENVMWIYITAAILVGTILVLLIIRFKQHRIWKSWFLLSIGICLYIALAQFVSRILETTGIDSNANIWPFSTLGLPITYVGLFTILLVIFLIYMKVYKKDIIFHNITEIFIYGGLAALIVPNISLSAAIALLIIISIYDMVAVWKTKHMVSMAKYQTENKLFAGLMMPYDKKSNKIPLFSKELKETKKSEKNTENKKTKKASSSIKTAILGGGDIAFPLIFAGTVMKTFASFLYPIIITITTAIALYLLLTYSKKDKFYPAMPFISGGSFAGYIIILIFFI